MSLDAPTGQDTNRFTIADYYDRDPSPSASSAPTDQHEPEPSTIRRLPAIPTSPTSPNSPSTVASSSRTGSAPVTLAPVLAAVRIKQGSGSTTSSSSSPKLRLHQPDDRPAYHPSTLTTSPTHPLSPVANLHQVQTGQTAPLSSSSSGSFNLGRLSSTSSDVRPLPSIPRSFSSATSADYEATSDRGRTPTLSPTMPMGGASVARSPGLSPMEEDDISSALSPPIMDHRHSSMSGQSGYSGVSGASNAWTAQDHGRSLAATDRHGDQEKDQDFAAAPTLNRGLGAKATTWWDRWFPASAACRLLLLTVVLETIIDLIIEVSQASAVVYKYLTARAISCGVSMRR